MKNKYLGLLLIGVLFVLTGCSDKDANSIVDFLAEIESGERIVYDVSINEFACYNLEHNELKHYCVDPKEKFKNTFAYHSNELGELYTIGDSVEGCYKILKLTHEGYEVLYEVDNVNEAIFPIAQDENIAFFSTEVESDNGMSSSIIIYTKNEGIYKVNNINMKTAILDGVIKDNWLFFSVYKDDSKFELYKWDYCSLNSAPELVRSDLISPQLYCYKDRIYYYRTNLLCIGDVEIPIDCSAYQKNDMIFVFKNHIGGNYTCEVFNLSTSKHVFTMKSAQAFSFHGNMVSLYSTYGEVKEITI